MDIFTRFFLFLRIFIHRASTIAHGNRKVVGPQQREVLLSPWKFQNSVRLGAGRHWFCWWRPWLKLLQKRPSHSGIVKTNNTKNEMRNDGSFLFPGCSMMTWVRLGWRMQRHVPFVIPFSPTDFRSILLLLLLSHGEALVVHSSSGGLIPVVEVAICWSNIFYAYLFAHSIASSWKGEHGFMVDG